MTLESGARSALLAALLTVAAGGCTAVVDSVLAGKGPGSTDAGPLPDGGPLDDGGAMDGGRDAGPVNDAGPDAGGTPDAGSDAGPPDPCEGLAVQAAPIVINSDTRWTADTCWLLDRQTFVAGDATLTLAAGTQVYGDGGALVVAPGSRLVVEGSLAAPVVFQSNGVRDGTAAPGDWGGVVLLGRAPVNLPGGEGTLDGMDLTAAALPAQDPALYTFGGTENSDCGELRFVRIEHAGRLSTASANLAGLTVAGCGAATNLDFVQVHRSLDDGLALHGGTADIRHLLATANGDDGVSWTAGWRGRAQFVAVIQYGGAAVGGRGIDGANHPTSPDSTPRSMPTLANVTLVGPPSAAATGELQGVRLHSGTAGRLLNTVVFGFREPCLRMEGPRTFAQYASTEPLDSSILTSCGSDGMTHLENVPSGLATRIASANQLGGASGIATPIDHSAPNLIPSPGSPAASGIAPPDDGFFAQSATYIGATQPNVATPWYLRWTTFER